MKVPDLWTRQSVLVARRTVYSFYSCSFSESESQSVIAWEHRRR